MSAETEITTLLSRVTASANFLAGKSDALVAESIADLSKAVKLPFSPKKIRAAGWTPAEFDWAKNLGGDRTEEDSAGPIGFPVWPGVDLGEIPEIVSVDTLEDGKTVVLDALNFPQFIYPTVAELAPFAGVAPSVDTTVALPSVPTTEVSFNPESVGLLPIDPPTLTAPTVPFSGIDIDIALDPSVFSDAVSTFSTSIFGALDPLLADLRNESQAALTVLFPVLMDSIRSRIQTPYALVQSFQAQLHQRLARRLEAETDRVMAALADASGWDRPLAAQQALARTASQVAQSWTAQAESQIEIKAAELAVAVFEVCGDLFASLQRGVQALRLQELEQTLEAHRFAVAYAKQAAAALLAAFEAEQITRQGAELKKAEAQIALFEAQLKLSALQYEIARAKLEAEKAKQDQDEGLIKKYQVETEKADKDVALYAAQAAAARIELDLATVPLDIFEAQVRAFDAKISAHQGRVNARLAEIDGDVAKAEAQMMKVKAFEAEVRGFESAITTKQTLLSTKSARNEGVIDAYKAQAKAALFGTERSLLKSQYDLSKHQVIADQIISEAETALKAAQVELEYQDRYEKGVLSAYEITRDLSNEVLEVELARLKSLSEINAQGARIVSSMAEGAMSAATGVAGAIVTEGG